MDAVAKLKVLFEADSSALDGALGKTGKEVEGLGGKLGGLNDKAMGMSKAVGVGILGAGAGIAAFGGMAVAAASDVAESQNKVNVVFGESASMINDLAATAASKLGQTKGEVLNAAGGIGNLLTAMGQSKEKAAEMSVEMVKLASDLGSFNNASSTEVLEAMQAAMAGETDGMKKYGVAITEATLKQAAMESGLGDNVQALSAAEKQMLSMKIMMEQTKSAQGDFANTSGGMANGMKIIKASISDAVASIGAGLLPAVEKAGQAFAAFLQSEKFEEFKTKLIDMFTAIGDKLAGVDFGAIADTILSVFTKIGDVFTWLSENPAIAKVVLAIGGLVAAFAPVMMIIGPLIPVVMSVVGAIGGLVAPIGAAVAAAGGFTAVLGTVAAVLTGPVAIAIGVIIGAYALWQAKGDEIKAAIAGLVAAIGAKWEEIKAWTSTAFDAIGAYLSAKWAEFTTMIGEKLTEIWTAVTTKWEEVKTAIADALEAIAENLRLKWDAFLRQISEKLDAILAKTTEAWTSVKKAIDDAMAAVEAGLTSAWDRVKGMIDAAWEAIGRLINSALNSISDAVWKALQWIEDKTGISMDAIQNIWDSAMGAIMSAVDMVVALLTGDWGAALDHARMAAEQAWDAIKGYFSAGWAAIKALLRVDEIVSLFSNLKDKLSSVGSDIVDGIKEGIAGSWEALKRFLQDQIGDLIALAKRILGIASPSKVFADEIGAPMGEGVIVGFGSVLVPEKAGDIVADWLKGADDSGIRMGGLIGRSIADRIVSGLTVALAGANFNSILTQWLKLDPGVLKAIAASAGAFQGAGGGTGAGRTGMDTREAGRGTGGRFSDMRAPNGPRDPGTVTAKWNTSGRGGHVAASKSNYWKVFVQKFGVPTESSAREVAERLGIPLPEWLEQMYKDAAGGPGVSGGQGPHTGFGGAMGNLGGGGAAGAYAGAMNALVPIVGQVAAALGTLVEPIRALVGTLVPISGGGPVPIPIEPPLPPWADAAGDGSLTIQNATVTWQSGTLITPPIDARVTITTQPTVSIGARTVEVLTTMVEERLADSFILGTSGR